MTTMTRQEVWAQLRQRGFVQGEMPAPGEARSPWFVRVMLGAAGWIGAWFLVGFVALGLAAVLKSPTASWLVGAGACAAVAMLFRAKRNGDFTSQFGLAVSLAGQVLMAYGLSQWVGRSFAAVALGVAAQQALLFLLMPNFVHRVWTAWTSAYAMSFALAAMGLQAFAPAAATAGFVVVGLREFAYPIVAAAVLTLRSIKAPGIGPAVAILALGHANGNRVLVGLGIAALIGYLPHYHHALHATLLEKSVLMGCAWLAVLAGVNWTIAQREQLILEGAVARLELAPVDPRSLMQGDYMALRFQLADQAWRTGSDRKTDEGRIVVKPDDKGVARYVRHDAGEPLAAGELRMRYRVREGRVKFATNAWFYQEGHARHYERARYGEFRAAPSGDMLLVNMLGEKLERLGPPD